MAKKRSCRRTEQERTNHEKAVAVRKMTDDQLVAHFEQQYKDGFEAGKLAALQEAASYEKHSFLKKIEKEIAGIKGIGAATLSKIRAVLGSL